MVESHAGRPGRAPGPPLPYLLVYAATWAQRHADPHLRAHGLTVRKYGLLVQLDLEPELTMSELARQLGVARQSLHEIVGELERAGYLRREAGASGRTRRLALTARARRLLPRHPGGALRQAEADLAGGLSSAEVETLRQLLRRLLAHVTDDEAWLAGG